MPLNVSIGQATWAGPKPRNEDAWIAVTPETRTQADKGMLFALADGVSGCADGRLAAVSTVRAVAADYYSTPETWAVAQALERLLGAHNRWLRSQQHSLLSTLTALVLRGRRFTVAHVGDCRLYRLSAGRFGCLTTEHVWNEPAMQHVLKRAMGLDEHLVPDFVDGDVAQGDVFVLLTDGVWSVLPTKTIDELVRLHTDPQRAADALIEQARAASTTDNSTVVVIRVDELPAGQFDDELSRSKALSLPPRLKPGQQWEGLRVEAVLADSPSSLAYKVYDQAGQPWVMKTLPATLSQDDEAQQQLLAEEWLQKRVSSRYVAEVRPLPQRQHLYYLLRWLEGDTLKQRYARHDSISADELVMLGLKLSRALGQLHRLNIVHRDIKPENILYTADGRLVLLDLGQAYCPGISPETGVTPGTPGFMAPELFEGSKATAASDIYAAGVCLYWLATGHYPYGEQEAFQRPVWGNPVLPGRYRPDMPAWLENVLLKAVDRDVTRRFETAEELQLALEQGESRPIFTRRHVPWVERASLPLWRGMALGSLLLNLLLFFMLLRR